MKKLGKLGLIMVLIIALFVSCEPGVTNGTVNFTVNPFDGAANYKVGIEGIEMREFKEAPHTEVFSLPAGTYVFLAEAYDSEGTLIATCSSSPITLSTGSSIDAEATLKSTLASLTLNVPTYSGATSYTIDVTGQEKVNKATTTAFSQNYTLKPGTYAITANALDSNNEVIAYFEKTLTVGKDNLSVDVVFSKIQALIEVTVPEVKGASRYELTLPGFDVIKDTKAFAHTYNLEKGSYKAEAKAYDSNNKLLAYGDTGTVNAELSKTVKANITWKMDGNLKITVPAYTDATSYEVVVDDKIIATEELKGAEVTKTISLHSGSHSITINALDKDKVAIAYFNHADIFIEAGKTRAIDVKFAEILSILEVTVPEVKGATAYELSVGSEKVTLNKSGKHTFNIEEGTYNVTAKALDSENRVIADCTTDDITTKLNETSKTTISWNQNSKVVLNIPVYEGASSYAIIIDGTPTAPITSSKEDISKEIILKSGEHTIAVQALDGDDIIAAFNLENKVFVESDKTKNIDVVFTKAEATITVTLPEVEGADRYVLTMTGSEDQKSAKPFTYSYKVAKGSYKATAKAYDKEDRLIAIGKELKFTVAGYDKVDGSITWNTNATLNINTDAFKGAASYTVSIDSKKTSFNIETKSITIPAGNHTISIQAYDAAKDMIAKSEEQTLFIEAGSSQSINFELKVVLNTLTVKALDLPNAVRYELHVTGQPIVEAQEHVYNLPKGDYVVRAKAFDKDENIIGLSQIEHYLVGKAPITHVIVWHTEGNVTVKVPAYDGATRYEFNDTEVEAGHEHKSSLAPGKYTFTSKAFDKDDHLVATGTFVADVTIGCEINGSITWIREIPYGSITLTYDKINTADSYVIKIDGTPVEDNATHTFKLSAIEHEICVEALNAEKNVIATNCVTVNVESWTTTPVHITLQEAKYPVRISFTPDSRADRFEIRIPGQATVHSKADEKLNSHEYTLPAGTHHVSVHAFNGDVEIANGSQDITTKENDPTLIDLTIPLNQIAANINTSSVSYPNATRYEFKVDGRAKTGSFWIETGKHVFECKAYNKDIILAESNMSVDINVKNTDFMTEFRPLRGDVTVRMEKQYPEATSYIVSVENEKQVITDITAGATFNLAKQDTPYDVNVIARASDNTEIAKWTGSVMVDVMEPHVLEDFYGPQILAHKVSITVGDFKEYTEPKTYKITPAGYDAYDVHPDSVESFWVKDNATFSFNITVEGKGLKLAEYVKEVKVTETMNIAADTYTLCAAKVVLNVPAFTEATEYQVSENDSVISTGTNSPITLWHKAGQSLTYTVKASDKTHTTVADGTKTITTVAGLNNVTIDLKPIFGTVVINAPEYKANEEIGEYQISVTGFDIHKGNSATFKLERDKKYNITVSVIAKTDNAIIAQSVNKNITIADGENNKVIDLATYTPLTSYLTVAASPVTGATDYKVGVSGFNAESYKNTDFTRVYRLDPEREYNISVVATDNKGTIANWHTAITLKAGEIKKAIAELIPTTHFFSVSLDSGIALADHYELNVTGLPTDVITTLPFTREYRVADEKCTIDLKAVSDDNQVIATWSETYVPTAEKVAYKATLTPVLGKVNFSGFNYPDAANFTVKVMKGSVLEAEMTNATEGKSIWLKPGKYTMVVEAYNASNELTASWTSETPIDVAGGIDQTVKIGAITICTGSVTFNFGDVPYVNHATLVLGDKIINVNKFPTEETVNILPGTYEAVVTFNRNDEVIGTWIKKDITVSRGSTQTIPVVPELIPYFDSFSQNTSYIYFDIPNAECFTDFRFTIDDDPRIMNIERDSYSNSSFTYKNHKLPVGNHTLKLTAKNIATGRDVTATYEFEVKEEGVYFYIDPHIVSQKPVEYEVYGYHDKAGSVDLSLYAIEWFREVDGKYIKCGTGKKLIVPEGQEYDYLSVKVKISKDGILVYEQTSNTLDSNYLAGPEEYIFEGRELNSKLELNYRVMRNGKPVDMTEFPENCKFRWYKMPVIEYGEPHEHDEALPESCLLQETDKPEFTLRFDSLTPETYFYNRIVLQILEVMPGDKDTPEVLTERSRLTLDKVKIAMDYTDLIEFVEMDEVYYGYDTYKGYFTIHGDNPGEVKRTCDIAGAYLTTLALSDMNAEGIGTCTFDYARIETQLDRPLEDVKPEKPSQPVNARIATMAAGSEGQGGGGSSTLQPHVAYNIYNIVGTYTYGKDDKGNPALILTDAQSKSTLTLPIINGIIRFNGHILEKLTGYKPSSTDPQDYRGTWKLPRQALISSSALNEVTRQWLDPMIAGSGFKDFNKLVEFEDPDHITAGINLKFEPTTVDVMGDIALRGGFFDSRVKIAQPFMVKERLRAPYMVYESDNDLEVLGEQIPMKFKLNKTKDVMVVTAVMPSAPGQVAKFTFPLIRTNQDYKVPELGAHFTTDKSFILENNFDVIERVVSACRIDSDLEMLLNRPTELTGQFFDVTDGIMPAIEPPEETRTVDLYGKWTIVQPEGETDAYPEYMKDAFFALGNGYPSTGGDISKYDPNNGNHYGFNLTPQPGLAIFTRRDRNGIMQYSNFRIETEKVVVPPETVPAATDPETPVKYKAEVKAITFDVVIKERGGYITEYKNVRAIRSATTPAEVLQGIVTAELGGVDFKLTLSSSGKMYVDVAEFLKKLEVGTYGISGNVINLGVDILKIADMKEYDQENIAYLSLGYNPHDQTIKVLENKTDEFGIRIE